MAGAPDGGGGRALGARPFLRFLDDLPHHDAARKWHGRSAHGEALAVLVRPGRAGLRELPKRISPNPISVENRGAALGVSSIVRAMYDHGPGKDSADWIGMDTLSPDARAERMGRIKGKDTAVELRVRRLVYRMGYRYRLHDRSLPGRPDLVFKARRKVIFVHGCFWHRHPQPTCKLARLPKSRLDFWLPKLEANRERDKRAEESLREMGWQSMVVWECESRHIEQLENKIRAFLEGREATHASH